MLFLLKKYNPVLLHILHPTRRILLKHMVTSSILLQRVIAVLHHHVHITKIILCIMVVSHYHTMLLLHHQLVEITTMPTQALDVPLLFRDPTMTALLRCIKMRDDLTLLSDTPQTVIHLCLLIQVACLHMEHLHHTLIIHHTLMMHECTIGTAAHLVMDHITIHQDLQDDLTWTSKGNAHQATMTGIALVPSMSHRVDTLVIASAQNAIHLTKRCVMMMNTTIDEGDEATHHQTDVVDAEVAAMNLQEPTMMIQTRCHRTLSKSRSRPIRYGLD
mmetsp:Transcript_2654/g.10182  ORF Transcript_2654/g.10182 Transcript_2654/m.10182 type:complete len:274 (-) Transcript_2654:401-1222(-)